MVKNWKEFILENKNLSKIGNLGLKEFNSKDYSLLGLTTTDITDWSYVLNKNKFYLSDAEIQFIDKDGWIRKDVKIGEILRPCIYISISSQSTSKENQETIKDIKGFLRKIKVISKFKSKTELNNMVVFDPTNTQSKSDLNIIGEIIKLEDPFSIISSKDNKIKYDYNNEETLSNNLDVCLYSDEEIEVTDKDFFSFYKLNTTETEYLDKDGKFWVEFDFKEIASAIFKDDELVETFFKPEDFTYDTFDVDKEHIISDVVSSISNENKEKLLRKIGDFDEMNNVTEEEYEDLEHLISNITDDDFELIFDNLDFDFHILSEIVWQYKDELNIKYQQKAESYIRKETIEYIEEYIKFDYYLHKDDENYKELIFIKYDPIIFEYGYTDSEYPDDWSDWANRLHSTNLDGSISETLDEHSNQISWNDYLGDDIYMSSNDINNYINDIL